MAKKKKRKKTTTNHAPRSRAKRSSGRRKKRRPSTWALTPTDLAIAGGTLGVAALAARANAGALKKQPNADKADMGWYRKMNLIKPVGIVGSMAAIATAVWAFTDVKIAKPIALGLMGATGVQLINHGGLFKKEESTATQGQLVIAAGVGPLALGGEILDERIDSYDAT